MSAPRIAVLIGEGRNISQVSWPSTMRVEVFEANVRGATRVAQRMENGTVDHVFLVVSKPNHEVMKLLPKGSAPVYVWTRGVPSLIEEMRRIVEVDLPKTTSLPRPQYVRVNQASKHPERRPAWTDEERSALRMAYEDAFDFQRVIEGFLSLTSDLDVPVRSQAEMKAEIERIRESTLEGEVFDAWPLLDAIAMVATVEWARLAVKMVMDILRQNLPLAAVQSAFHLS
jgi:hypothetical protein